MCLNNEYSICNNKFNHKFVFLINIYLISLKISKFQIPSKLNQLKNKLSLFFHLFYKFLLLKEKKLRLKNLEEELKEKD